MIIKCETGVDTRDVARILAGAGCGLWINIGSEFDLSRCSEADINFAMKALNKRFGGHVLNGVATLTPKAPVIEYKPEVPNSWFVDEIHKNAKDVMNKLIQAKIASDSLLIRCDDERQKMLCEQVIRMCRGEASQFKRTSTNKWEDKVPTSELYTNIEYRAKPKKELVVPWEFIADDIIEITVSEDNSPYCKTATNHWGHVLRGLKLDLDGIDLPVTVTRPCS